MYAFLSNLLTQMSIFLTGCVLSKKYKVLNLSILYV